ncbi:hypothetical protein K461DRAFT_293846 [Myriangium duriaei CBS 260.36]|uniref:Fungal N-terminal domain-containing protein n=1 Tax=Myriangium duriaei CBS 260.36 TaxID=1168546 RepID=A0A9P4J180_9PEZI|nr:hypothetical protein K461DRAFT_293846 [Myriangium duriaei CBS 260.36]
MDPISAVVSAQEIAGLCATIVKKIKSFIEAVKGAKQALIDMLDRMERMRLLVNEFKSLAQRLKNSSDQNINLAFNDSECMMTLRRVQSLVDKVTEEAHVHDYWMQIKWVRHKEEAGGLLTRLASHERDLGTVLQFIAARSSVTTEQAIQYLMTHLKSQSILIEPFHTSRLAPSPQATSYTKENLTEITVPLDQDTVSKVDVSSLGPTACSPLASRASSPPRQWLVCMASEFFSADYIRQRNKLSDAAFGGTWDVVLRSIEMGTKRFGENWANAPRLKPMSEASSQWTPLHQAAYMGAPLRVIEQLLVLGASRNCQPDPRTLVKMQKLIEKHEIGTNRTRTAGKSLPYHDMTAFDIAGSLGYTGLLAALSPVVRHYLPAETVLDLQNQLQMLTGQLIDNTTLMQSVRIPDLSVLMELEEPSLELVLPKSAGLENVSSAS